jgi:hypothetical protein
MNREPSNAELMTALVELHGTVTQGFVQVDVRFAHVDVRFERLETRIASIETHVTSMDGELKGIHHWMARSDTRFAELEGR